MDLVYEYSGNDSQHGTEIPLLMQIRIALHTLMCANCTREIERYKETRNILREDFFPPSPNLEDTIMAKVHLEQIAIEKQIDPYTTPSPFSTRGWVIAGIIIMVSLITTFFGLDFQNLANESGMSYLLPMGITIGIVLTTYCAFFIGSHLKELSERFGL
jgi:hypothetical protein